MRPDRAPRQQPRITGGWRRAAIPVAGAVALVAVVAIPTGGLAGQSNSYRFGAKVNRDVPPSNASSPHPCAVNPGRPCTWILNDAYGRPGPGAKAKRDGRIKLIKLVAGAPGNLRLQLVKVKPNGRKAKVPRNGPRLTYRGQPESEDPTTFRVERFRVNVPVKKGEQLAFKAKRTSVLRCSSGGDNTLQVSPAAKPSQGFRRVNGSDGCWILLDAKVRY